MQYFIDTSGKTWAFEDDVKVSAASGALVFTAPSGVVLVVPATLSPTSGPPTPPAPTIAQQAAAALNAGLAITSTATPALDATYACDPDTISNVQAEVVSILLNGAFTNGASMIEWPTITGAAPWPSFTVAQFKTLATALAAYIGALKPIMAMNAGTLPAATVTIP